MATPMGPPEAPKVTTMGPLAPMARPMTPPTAANPRSLRLGILVPSSNTALEPLTHDILASIDDPYLKVSVHFSRFPVKEISLTPDSLAQFIIHDDRSTDSPIMAAARLLTDAHVDVIGFSGTSGSWLGFDVDEALCAAITKALGVPATTSTLGLHRALALLGVKDVLIVTPYTADVQERIVDVFRGAGYCVLAESHLGISENAEFAKVSQAALDHLVHLQMVLMDQSIGPAAAIAILCTNLVAAQRVKHWESGFVTPVLDSVATVIWDMLRICGVRKGAVKGWGKLFDL